MQARSQLTLLLGSTRAVSNVFFSTYESLLYCSLQAYIPPPPYHSSVPSFRQPPRIWLTLFDSVLGRRIGTTFFKLCISTTSSTTFAITYTLYRLFVDLTLSLDCILAVGSATLAASKGLVPSNVFSFYGPHLSLSFKPTPHNSSSMPPHAGAKA